MKSDLAFASTSLTNKPRQSLRDYQRELAERTRSAQALRAMPSRQLGFFAAAQGWLIDLNDAAEIMPVPAVTPVPGTQRWFLGLMNYRGRLTGVVDFECFLGDESPSQLPKHAGRLIVLSDRFSIATALRVAAVSGLVDLDAHADPSPQASISARTSDIGKPVWQGNLARIGDQEWRRLDVRALLADHSFVNAALR